MLIEIHMIQNHSPANLNRDDLGAPKTCYFGGYLRSRISSQCLKRSIRKSKEFEILLGGVRTRQLAKLIEEEVQGKAGVKKRAASILNKLGIKTNDEDRSDMLVYTSKAAISEMAQMLQNEGGKSDEDLAVEFGKFIVEKTSVPDMALSGRMLETGSLDGTTVEAALQASHAMSTHEARPEVDYYVAADDIKGSDHGAGYVDESMFNSACFYKYFSIHWEQLLENLKGQEELAGHTVGAFLRGAAKCTPSGKQNSFAAHNPPDGILVEFKASPVSYANAFVKPVRVGERDLVGQSIAELAKYVGQYEQGYGKPDARFWFSMGGRYPLTDQEGKTDNPLNAIEVRSLDELVKAVVKKLDLNWDDVQKVKL
jgi:CRISPR system Cascade subunit CasC